jgi:hypothetical protein
MLSGATLAALMLFGGAPIALIGMGAGALVKALCFPRQLSRPKGKAVLGPEPRIEWREPAPF